MPPKAPGFTHRDRFAPYMTAVADLLPARGDGRTALDLPAGAGHFGQLFAQRGYQVTNADFNRDDPSYVFADMTKRLPFDDGTFDVVTCLEGIEHLLDPFHVVGELARVLRDDGYLVISTPNIMCYWSRVQFLFTGTFFQFCPTHIPSVGRDEQRDRGHVSPVGYAQLRAIAAYHQLDLVEITTEKVKRAALLPCFWLLELIGRPWKRALTLGRKAAAEPDRNRRIWRDLNSPPLLLGRTAVFLFRKAPPALKPAVA